MSNVLGHLEPKRVFEYFEAMNQIPRGSYNEAAVSNWLKECGEKLGLETIQDKVGNIIIKKPASEGYEDCPAVILQGHMDMVCVKGKGSNHDFTKDPIEMKIVDDMIYANNTTLGADDGIAIAMSLAILEDDNLKHPALEAVFTINEESGMDGAYALDTTLLTGKYLLNIDSEEEGFFTIGCAGGRTPLLTLDKEYKDACSCKKALKVVVTDLLGGHSGQEIQLQRANATKVVVRMLNALSCEYDLADLTGGTMHNAIPNHAEAVIMVEDVEAAKAELNETFDAIRREFSVSEPNMKVLFEDACVEKVYSDCFKERFLTLLTVLPHGVNSYTVREDGSLDTSLPESSTNMAAVHNDGDQVKLTFSIRSARESIKEEIAKRVELLTKALGFKYEVIAGYPAWEVIPNSRIEQICSVAYEKVSGKKPEIIAIHAGLECGLLLDKMDGVEAISIGPDMYDVHSENEHLNIPSTERTYKLLIDILESMK